MANPFQIAIALAASDDDGISTSASPGAGAILINGALASGGVATLDVARRVLFTSGSDDSLITFTVTGTTRNGQPLTETLAGGTSTAVTTQDFKTVTGITHSGSVAGTLKVGTNGTASSPWFFTNYQDDQFNLGIGVVVSGSVSYTVEYTYDNPNAPFTDTFPTVFDITALSAQTASKDAALIIPVYAVRLTQNSFSASGNEKMIIIQAGLGGGC